MIIFSTHDRNQNHHTTDLTEHKQGFSTIELPSQDMMYLQRCFRQTLSFTDGSRIISSDRFVMTVSCSMRVYMHIYECEQMRGLLTSGHLRRRSKRHHRMRHVALTSPWVEVSKWASHLTSHLSMSNGPTGYVIAAAYSPACPGHPRRNTRAWEQREECMQQFEI